MEENKTFHSIVFKDLEEINQRKQQKVVELDDKKKEVALKNILDIMAFFGDKS
ncbi:hypothetical protein ACWOFR_04325 [Carnobacterium gallinarum]|uniref:hypothetical protein n=1 Tax=Carnobacterium gallinarum TaxID=2749 RepID=UPI000B0958AC|nr:hypothetical protein [Carnobacterium gallinarum]